MIFLIAYLLGCIQSGVLISKFYNICDPRHAGSNNIGATNMWRLHGWQFGVATFVLDILKIFSIYVIGNYYYSGQYNIILMSLGTLGHLYPIHTPLQGGKGIACSFMLLLLYNPFMFIITAGSWLISYKITSTSGTSSSIAMFICLGLSFIYPSDLNIIFVRIILILCLFKHRINIKDAIIEYRSTVL